MKLDNNDQKSVLTECERIIDEAIMDQIPDWFPDLVKRHTPKDIYRGWVDTYGRENWYSHTKVTEGETTILTVLVDKHIDGHHVCQCVSRQWQTSNSE